MFQGEDSSGSCFSTNMIKHGSFLTCLFWGMEQPWQVFAVPMKKFMYWSLPFWCARGFLLPPLLTENRLVGSSHFLFAFTEEREEGAAKTPHRSASMETIDEGGVVMEHSYI